MTSAEASLEKKACQPEPVQIKHFNRNAKIPYGLSVKHICAAMNEYIDFIGFINQQLNERGIPRLETMLMPANFSSIVGEFMISAIPKYCPELVKNNYHNGHPDMVPKGYFPNDSIQHAQEGIEIKGSRYLRGWQGHNAEETWLMVFCFNSGRPADEVKGVEPFPFCYRGVFGAKLEQADWTFSGRSENSRRTITASVNGSGYKKMTGNWIYKAPDLTA